MPLRPLPSACPPPVETASASPGRENGGRGNSPRPEDTSGRRLPVLCEPGSLSPRPSLGSAGLLPPPAAENVWAGCTKCWSCWRPCGWEEAWRCCRSRIGELSCSWSSGYSFRSSSRSMYAPGPPLRSPAPDHRPPPSPRDARPPPASDDTPHRPADPESHEGTVPRLLSIATADMAASAAAAAAVVEEEEEACDGRCDGSRRPNDERTEESIP